MTNLLRNRYFIACILLIIVLILAFYNIVFLGKTLTTSALPVGTTRTGPYLYPENKPLLPVPDGAASAWHWEPAMQLNSQAYNSRELPLWNPYNGAGQPLAADMQSSSFNPIALPVILNPSPSMWDFFLLFRLFLAGLFTFMFLRLINIKTTGAIAGSITFMLSGYLMFFVNMAHLSVEILIPLMFFAVEFLIQRKNMFATTVLATAIALVIVGGMPESAALNFCFAFAYFSYRIAIEYKDKKNRGQLRKIFGLAVAALISGLLISAVSWAPFVEYSKNFFSTHQKAGKGALSLAPKYIIQYMAPMFLGVQNTAYVGIIPLFLILVSKKKHPFKWFFIASAALIGLKIFGIGVNWLGHLPLINKIFFYKYGQALLAFSVAVLLAFSINSGLKIRLKRALIIAFIWGATLIYFYKNFPKLFDVKLLRLDYYTPIHLKWALVFLTLAFILATVAKLFKRIRPEHLAIAATALIFIELWFHIPASRAQRHDPYIAPPFVKYLQAQNVPFRTYASDAVLWPNTNAPYKIQDVRSLNAMQPTRYMEYLSLFSDLKKLAHVTGLEGVNLDSPFFDALNVKYVLALKPPTKNLDYWLEVQKIPKVQMDDGVWFQAPFSAYFKIPLDVKYINFDAKAANKSALSVKSVFGNKTSLLLEKKIEPQISNYRFDVSTINGRYVKLEFSGNAYINSLHYSNGTKFSDKFKLVYTDNKVKPAVQIYENSKALPRVMVYDQVIKAANQKVDQLKNLDIHKKAIVEKELNLSATKNKLDYQVKIISYEPNEVTIKASTNKKALLVLADTYYPGWKAYVNGKEKEVLPVNHMFRGVIIEPGESKVVFSYQSNAYKTGFSFLGAGLLAMTLAGVVLRRPLNLYQK